MGARPLNEVARSVLSIGTMESRGMVGLGLDLRLLGARGILVQTVVVAISAQGPSVHNVVETPAASVEAQFASIDRARVGAVRIGALPSNATIACVARHLRHYAGIPVVIDPVSISSRGGRLALEDTTAALLDRLIPLATIVLPNVDEARALTGVDTSDDGAIVRAARLLVARGARAALVTGGHRAGDPTDVLVDRTADPRRFTATRIDRDMRGTGCVLAISLAAEFVEAVGEPSSDDLVTAIERARATVRTTIAHARRVGDQWVA